MPKMKDLTGRKYGRLTVIKPLEERRNGNVVWKTKCECGNEFDVIGSSLTRNHTKSCGCLKKEYAKENMVSNWDNIKGKRIKENTDISLLNEVNFKNNTSGIRGVHFDKSTKSWLARISFKKTSIYLGRFKDIKDAIKARKDAEERYYKPILDKYAKDE